MAIAFVNKANTVTGSSTTPSLTADATGANRAYFGFTLRSSRSISVAPTWGGVTMTQSGASVGTSNILNYLYYIDNPLIGNQTVTLTQSASDNWACGAIWFSGARTGAPDATSVGGPTTTTSYSQSVTANVANCFAVLWGDATSGAALTGGTNTTVANQPEVAFTGAFLIYSTASRASAGTFTLNVTSSSQTFAGCMSSIAPTGAGGLTTLNAG